MRLSVARMVALAVGAGAVIVGLLFVLSVLTDQETVTEAERRSIPVTRTEAVELLHRAVRHGADKQFSQMCRTVGASYGTCYTTAASSSADGQAPNANVPQVTGTTRYPPTAADETYTLVLHLKGERLDGSHYTSDFAVIHNDAGAPRSLTAPYWSGVNYIHRATDCPSGPSPSRCERIQEPTAGQ